MKVTIGPYKRWIGPYQIAEKILFWKNRHHEDPVIAEKNQEVVHKFGDWLDNKLPWFTDFCSWIDGKKKRKIKIRIDGYDTWSMDHTLALIITPMLKKMQKNKHSGPWVDDEDVPEGLRRDVADPQTEEEKNNGHADSNWFKRWDWVLNEMIWTFEQHAMENWEDQYHSGNVDIQIENGRMIDGPNHTFKVDSAGIMHHRKRMENGRRLFAKYYESLWS